MGIARKELPMQFNTDEQMPEEDDWDFYVEASQAWRAWRVVELDGIILLESITYRVPWIPRQEMVAECRSTKPSPPHLCPSMKHRCGIYSVKTQEYGVQWQKYLGEHFTVVYGRVSIWGNTFKFTKGYISEYAYPSYLYVPTTLGEDLNTTLSPEELSNELRKTYVVETELT